MESLTQKRRKQRLKYVVVDMLCVLIAWFLFFVFRRLEIESSSTQNFDLFSPIYNFEKLVLGIPLYWFFVFWLSGYYNLPFRKSRLEELSQTVASIFLGSLGLFFVLLLNDPVGQYTDYYLAFGVLFLIYFVVVYIGRYTLTRITTYNIHHRVWGFNTLIIGTGNKAMELYKELQSQEQSSGHIIEGFVSVDSSPCSVPSDMVLGGLTDLEKLLSDHKVEEVIVAMDSDDKKCFYDLVSSLVEHDVEVRVTPRLYDLFAGGVRLSSIYGAPLVNFFDVRFSEHDKNVKRFFDVTSSLLFLVLLSPLLLVVSLLVRFTSEGPVIYQQERVGLKGKLFKIYKFRTMAHDSEGSVPQLASRDDRRVTRVGKFLRKYRIDEVPQFINVLKGDMSLVGPRPERPYFVEKIEEKVPYYRVIHKVRPGITSWGMVKYGYADSVDKMIERLKYDIIYLENLSLLIDVKILIYTIKTVFTGRGV